MYTYLMDVAVTELRKHLSDWIDEVRAGTDVVITDRGTPVARIVAVDSESLIDRWTAEGIVSRPESPTKTQARRTQRPRPRSSVADLISGQRR